MLLNDYDIAFFVLNNKEVNHCKNVNLKKFNFKYEEPIHHHIFARKLFFLNNNVNKSSKKKNKIKKNKTEKI